MRQGHKIYEKSASHIGRCQQTRHDLPIREVRRNDFIDICLVHIRVPNCFRVHHSDRPPRATVQATGFVDADLAGAQQAQRLGLRLAMVERLYRALVCTALLARFALVGAEKDVPLVVRGSDRCG